VERGFGGGGYSEDVIRDKDGNSFSSGGDGGDGGAIVVQASIKLLFVWVIKNCMAGP